MPRKPTILVRLPAAATPLLDEISQHRTKAALAKGEWSSTFPASQSVMQALVEYRDRLLMKQPQPTRPLPAPQPHRH